MELLDDRLSRFTVENTTAGNFSISDGVLEVRGPEGWLRSIERFADFELVTEFRFMTDDADSGIFVRKPGTQTFRRGWPTESYQVQIRNPRTPSPFPAVGGLFRHGRPHGATDFDGERARAASRPAGHWQSLLTRVEGEALVVTLNGVETTRATGLVPGPGHIGIQGETGILEFRSVDLRRL